MKPFAQALVGSFLLLFVPLPWGFVGFGLAVAAFVLCLVIVVMMRLEEPVIRWALVVLGLAASLSLAVIYWIAFTTYDELLAFDECKAGAITIAARDLCSQEFEDASRAKLLEVGPPLSWFAKSDS